MVKKSDRKPKGGKHNPIVIVTCCVLIIVGMVAVSVFINSKNIESDTREKMTTYLQKNIKRILLLRIQIWESSLSVCLVLGSLMPMRTVIKI